MFLDVSILALPGAAEAPPSLSVPLAVEDFLPTLLAFFGFLLLAPSWLGRIGAVLMGAGGAAKSTWKLLHSAWAIEVNWLDDLLFPLLAAGGLLLAISLHKSLNWWRWPLLVIGVGVATLAVQARSVQPAFILATVMVVWISILGAVRAWKHGNALAAGLFIVGLLAVMALVPLRGHAASDALMFQWVQQGINTMAQGIFCLAGFLTYRAVRGRGADFEHRSADDFALRPPVDERAAGPRYVPGSRRPEAQTDRFTDDRRRHTADLGRYEEDPRYAPQQGRHHRD